MSLFKDCMYKISVKRNVLETFFLSGNGVFNNMQYAVNQLREMMAFFCLISELKAL